MIYNINKYSVDENFTIISRMKTDSNVIDHMIRLTAKITECFAGDIFYDIEALKTAILYDKDLKRLLLFQEHGVTTYIPNGINYVEFSNNSVTIQAWLLTYNSTTKMSILRRVNLIPEEYKNL